MAKRRISMRKIREVLRLRFECELSHRAIASSIGVSQSTVGDCLNRAKAAQVSWPLDPELTDEFLEKILYQTSESAKARECRDPDFSYIHGELRRKGVTLQLLWHEHRQIDPNGLQYSQFCNKYRKWKKSLNLVMRQHHRPGEKVFVDYAGHTVPIYDQVTGEQRFLSQIFVATMGASGYTYAEASRSQDKSSWINSHINAFKFFGGCPQLVIPDNLRSAVSKSCRYEPDINPTYYDMAKHYGVAIMPARVRKPKDKAKAEGSVLLAERWILAALRNFKFFSLFELNLKISELLRTLNSKQFQKIEGSRESHFLKLDKPALKPLPENHYEMTQGRIARVHIDYHIEVEKHYYSVPYQLARKEVEVRYNERIVEIYHRNKRVASHARHQRLGGYTTLKEHMPSSHREYAEWTPERLISWARNSGEATSKVAEAIIASKPHPEIGFKAVLGVISLGKKYGAKRLEMACQRALAIGSPTYRSVKSTLASGLDQKPLLPPQNSSPISHDNIRGSDYYERLLKERT